jgi:hypothetical protein
MSIKIKNISTSLVSLYMPSIRFNRDLNPGRIIPLTQEEYDELSSDPGFNALLSGHYIKLMGVNKEKQVDIIENVVEASEINDMLIKGDVTSFAKFIPHATIAEKETVVTLAVDHKITHPGIVALIKKYCDVDIIEAINVKHQSEEK